MAAAGDESGSAEDLPRMTLLEHLEELRRRLLASVVAMLVGFLACFALAKPIYRFLSMPITGGTIPLPIARWIPSLPDAIVFERTLRYPAQPDAPTNFDSGTGFLLFARLLESGAFRDAGEGRMTTDLASLRAALADLAGEIEALERLAPDAYKAAARDLVRRYLPEGAPGERYAPPPDICARLGLHRDAWRGAPVLAA